MKGFTTAAALAGILMLGAAYAGTMSSDSTMSKPDDGMAHSSTSAMHHKDAMSSKSSMSHGTMSGPNAMSPDHKMGHNMQHNAMQSSHGTMTGPSHSNAMSSGHMTAHMDKKKDKMKHDAMSGSSMSHSDSMMAKPH